MLPTLDSDDNVVEGFFSELHQCMTGMKTDIFVVMGDLNAKVWEGRGQNVIRDYGLGTRNERGKRFIQFCIEYKLVIMNIFFKLPERRTWKSPADTRDKPIRNQIEHIYYHLHLLLLTNGIKTQLNTLKHILVLIYLPTITSFS